MLDILGQPRQKHTEAYGKTKAYGSSKISCEIEL